MINDRPPRDARDAKPQQGTGADPTFDFHSNGRNEDVAGRDLPVAELPTLSSPTLRQWYPSSMNTSGPNQSPPSGMESTANTENRPWSVGASPVHRGSITRHDLQGSALNDHPRPFYDQGHMPPRGSRGDPRGILLQPHASGAQLPVTTPIPLPAGFYTGQSHDRVRQRDFSSIHAWLMFLRACTLPWGDCQMSCNQAWIARPLFHRHPKAVRLTSRYVISTSLPMKLTYPSRVGTWYASTREPRRLRYIS